MKLLLVSLLLFRVNCWAGLGNQVYFFVCCNCLFVCLFSCLLVFSSSIYYFNCLFVLALPSQVLKPHFKKNYSYGHISGGKSFQAHFRRNIIASLFQEKFCLSIFQKEFYCEHILGRILLRVYLRRNLIASIFQEKFYCKHILG